MKFSTREDIEVPIAYAFGQVSDFASFERRAMRQGADIVRWDTGPVCAGTAWDIAFKFRGRSRRVVADLTRFTPPEGMLIESNSDGLLAVTTIDLVALSQTRTRILVSFDMRAKSLTARLLLQSLRLAKVRLTKRFNARVKDYAEEIEDRFRRNG